MSHKPRVVVEVSVGVGVELSSAFVGEDEPFDGGCLVGLVVVGGWGG